MCPLGTQQLVLAKPREKVEPEGRPYIRVLLGVEEMDEETVNAIEAAVEALQAPEATVEEEGGDPVQ